MKFGKVLKTWAEMPENSENSDLVLRFKELKKQLKLVKPSDAGEFLKSISDWDRVYLNVHEWIQQKSGTLPTW